MENEMTNLEQFRAEKDQFFADHPQSPLSPDQKEDFEGLKYFPENADLRVETKVDEFDTKEQLQIQTSIGDVRYYTRFGKINFDVVGKTAELNIYENEFGLFLPFVDSLANTETYGAGRYLEPERLPNGKYLVDFNLAYNPYCAYNEFYSCPLTPWENRLNVPIRAGEKIFKEYV
jgi:uncharacterized protein (DUF1684 family)